MNIPQPLLDDIASGKCLPIIGAGFSMNAHLTEEVQMPLWSDLTETLAKTCHVSSDLGGPNVASEYEKMFGRVQLIEAIRQALHIDIAEPGEAHKAFIDLSFDTIYTTNFDLLLEMAYSTTRKPFRSLVGELQMPFHGGSLMTSIIKMHGDLNHEEHIIITKEDYEKYLTNYPVIATHLSAMLITKTALFIGYSLNDPDFNNLRQVVRSRLGKFERMAYIIQFDTSPSKDEASLTDNLHVISVSTDIEKSRDSKLAELFQTIQEKLDSQEGAKFRAERPSIFEEIEEEIIKATSKAIDASPLLTSSSSLCFVLMPFISEFDWIYRELIKPVVEKFGLIVLRADEISAPGVITEQIRTSIQQARLCIADVSGQNANVFYEVGLAQTLGKPTLLLTKDINDIPFDLKSNRFIVYDPNSLDEAKRNLESSIQNVLGEDRLDEARRLIDNGMYRAGVAMLGVLLEHGFQQLSLKNIIELKGRNARGLGVTYKILTDAGIIQPEDSSQLKECVIIRNKAIHELKEPRPQDAIFMLNFVQDFLKKYLGSDFLEDSKGDA